MCQNRIGTVKAEMENVKLFFENYGLLYTSTIIIAFLGILTIRNIIRIVEKLLIGSTVDASLINFISTIVKILLYLALLFICLGRLNVPLNGVVSALSAITLAIGLAVQDIIGGVANGIMMVTSKLFKVNDYVDIGDYSGSVKEIKLLHTVLVTPDNKTITIPNKVVFSSSITNYSEYKVRRLDTIFGIDYDSNVEKAKRVLLELASSSPLVLKDPKPMIVVKELKDSEIDLLLRVWFNSKDYWDLTWFLNEKGLDALVKEGIEVPYPQLTLSYRKGEKKK